jgi:hypothetical protein
MSTSLSYISNKFREAVYALVTGKGDARSRIGTAYYFFWTIPIDDFPKSLHKDRQAIDKLLTRLGGDAGYILPQNLSRMKNSTAAKAAALILKIHYHLIELAQPNLGARAVARMERESAEGD